MAFDTDKYTKSPFIKGDDLEEGERTIVTIKSAQEVAFPSGDKVHGGVWDWAQKAPVV